MDKKKPIGDYQVNITWEDLERKEAEKERKRTAKPKIKKYV